MKLVFPLVDPRASAFNERCNNCPQSVSWRRHTIEATEEIMRIGDCMAVVLAAALGEGLLYLAITGAIDALVAIGIAVVLGLGALVAISVARSLAEEKLVRANLPPRAALRQASRWA